MSTVIKKENGSYRLFSKGAAEIIIKQYGLLNVLLL